MESTNIIEKNLFENECILFIKNNIWFNLIKLNESKLYIYIKLNNLKFYIVTDKNDNIIYITSSEIEYNELKFISETKTFNLKTHDIKNDKLLNNELFYSFINLK